MSIWLEQISVHEGDAILVNDCTLSITPGERFVLLGPEGAGKGTLLRVIAGFYPVDHGRVLLEGREVTRVPARLRDVGIVLREPALFNRMSVAENVAFALGALGVPMPERGRRARELLGLAALDIVGEQYPARLSVGQRYRTAIVRALAHAPRLLLLEDPCAGLDTHDLDDLQATLECARERFQATVLLSTSEPSVAWRLGDRVGVMSAGRVLETGSPDSLYLRPRTRFTARCLGTANLLTGQLERDGIRLGGQLYPLADPPPVRRLPGHATVLVRPEDVALAAAPYSPPGPAVGAGIVERVERFGKGQRLHVNCDGFWLDSGDTSNAAVAYTSLVVTRPAAQTRQEPLAPGQRVAIGLRRIHVLPSQLCSLWLAAGTPGTDTFALADSRMVRALAAGMQVTPSFVSALRPGASVPSTALCVVSGWGRQGVEAVLHLLELGAQQVLLLRDPDRPFRQMWMRSQPARGARERMLSIGASLLRYLPMEATLLVPDLRRPVRGGRYRMLLDLRRAALDHHGLDLRTELQPGELREALRARLRQASGPVLLALGAVSPAGAREVLTPVMEMFSDHTPLGALLITCARARPGAVVTSVSVAETGQRAVA